MSEDQNFDGLAEKFNRKIYGGYKGDLRLAVIEQDLEEFVIPNLSAGAQILDAGGGIGQMSLRLAEKGFQIVLCDISSEMLGLAESAFKQKGLEGQLTLIQSPIQKLPGSLRASFELVLCHAVMEWMATPEQLIPSLVPFIRPKGFFSLLFYNLNSILIRNLIRGNFNFVEKGDYRGQAGGLTPQNPLLPEQVYAWLEARQLHKLQVSGVRCFSDYLSRELLESRSKEDLLKMEMTVCRGDPFVHMARYIHVVSQFS